MKRLILACTLILSAVTAADADQLSIDAPLLDQTDVRVNEQIFNREKNGVLSNADAAALQALRGNIMKEANRRRSRNNGILPTPDMRELVSRLQALEKQITRIQ